MGTSLGPQDGKILGLLQPRGRLHPVAAWWILEPHNSLDLGSVFTSEMALSKGHKVSELLLPLYQKTGVEAGCCW